MKILTLLIAVSSLLFFATKVPSADSPISQALVTTGVTSSARPLTDNLTVVDHQIGTVTFYTEIIGLAGHTVVHQWLYQNREVASITLNINSDRSLNWSRSSISPSQLGHWEVRVVDQQGNVLMARHFDVVESGRTVQQIVQEKQIDICQVKLANLREKVDANPEVEYFRFIYEKQLERCNES